MMNISRRQFGMAAGVSGLLGTGAWAQSPTPSVQFADGGKASTLGQGSFLLAEGRRPADEEEKALATGLSLGMTLIDTAEMYGNGTAEQMIGRVIAGRRDQVFLVSKVLPHNATPAGIQRACQASLARLGTSYLDLYLLHWRDANTNLPAVVQTFEQLRAAGHIRRWGVSNFDVNDMEELFKVRGGDACATNQVRYNLTDRSIERELMPWSERRGMPIMAYSPLGKGGAMLKDPVLLRVADRHGAGAAATALAWTMRSGRVMTIPTSGSVSHVQQNAHALALRLAPNDLADLDRAFPA